MFWENHREWIGTDALTETRSQVSAKHGLESKIIQTNLNLIVEFSDKLHPLRVGEVEKEKGEIMNLVYVFKWQGDCMQIGHH